MLKSYLKSIHEIASRGDAREESYYSTLEDLLKQYADSVGKKNIKITILPKKTEAGNPDFRIWDGKQHIVGYIEAKPPTIEHLDQIETTEQLKRYLHTFPNVILTNFFEFRLYRNGVLRDRIPIARPFIVHKLMAVPPVENDRLFFQLLEQFFSFSLPKVYNAQTLAIELAKRTRFLKEEVVTQELKEEETKGHGFIAGFYDAFKQYLIRGLTKMDFADLYSQTITYGLFAARTRSENGFSRKLAYDNIPHTIGILRDIFRFISFEDIPQQMEWIIDDIAEVLAVTDVNNILHRYFHEGRGKDPVVHFYETFLTEYDPKTREKRGVYYTPESVVSYIVRSLHHVLKEHFDKEDGFADEAVTVLDPAAGTLTFLAEAAKLAMNEFVSKYGEGGKENFIKEHLLENFYAFELMMAPYAVGHLKMSFLLDELGYKLQKDDRVKLYLTNTLEMEELEQTELPGMSSLSEESHLAGKVKKRTPILIILGNPPYSGISANMNPWIDKLLKKDVNGLQSYYEVNGKPLGERKLWLQDDYVKFIRFGQWKIAQLEEGVLGFITNHSYLDNPTFRGMRQSLINSFNAIYILNIHGGTLKKEKCPNGSKDENVFDIMQGVSIALYVKKKNNRKECEIFYADLWGLRDEKNKFLSEKSIKNTDWQKLKPTTPYYFLIPREEKGRKVYESYRKLTDIFPINSVGIVTARDKFAVDFDRHVLRRRIELFRDLSVPHEFIRQTFKLKDTSTFKMVNSRNILAKDENWSNCYTNILYRPFDKRHIYYTKSVVERPLLKVMHNMLQDNLGLIGMRQYAYDVPNYNYAFVTDIITESRIFVSNRGIASVFPLYLYPVVENRDIFSKKKASAEKQVNINQSIMSTLSKIYRKELSPEDIFYYVYSILFSCIYRTVYAEFLKIDFPRVPFTKNIKLFEKLREYGKRLTELHLLQSAELDPPVAKFQGKGDDKVEKVSYEKGNVLINRNQYFEDIGKEIWEYQIGGYQVCGKWLKDRKGRNLSLDDIKHYCRLVTALKKTMEIQEKIDKIYPEVEKRTVEFEK